MPKLYGRFFFLKTDNGNLIGEFSNNLGTVVSTESSDFTEPCADIECSNCRYCGTYHSTWQEDGAALFAELKISKKAGTDKLFSLKWRRNTKLIFLGEGMLFNGMLIGDYREPTSTEKTA